MMQRRLPSEGAPPRAPPGAVASQGARPTTEWFQDDGQQPPASPAQGAQVQVQQQQQQQQQQYPMGRGQPIRSPLPNPVFSPPPTLAHHWASEVSHSFARLPRGKRRLITAAILCGAFGAAVRLSAEGVGGIGGGGGAGRAAAGLPGGGLRSATTTITGGGGGAMSLLPGSGGGGGGLLAADPFRPLSGLPGEEDPASAFGGKNVAGGVYKMNGHVAAGPGESKYDGAGFTGVDDTAWEVLEGGGGEKKRTKQKRKKAKGARNRSSRKMQTEEGEGGTGLDHVAAQQGLGTMGGMMMPTGMMQQQQPGMMTPNGFVAPQQGQGMMVQGPSGQTMMVPQQNQMQQPGFMATNGQMMMMMQNGMMVPQPQLQQMQVQTQMPPSQQQTAQQEQAKGIKTMHIPHIPRAPEVTPPQPPPPTPEQEVTKTEQASSPKVMPAWATEAGKTEEEIQANAEAEIPAPVITAGVPLEGGETAEQEQPEPQQAAPLEAPPAVEQAAPEQSQDPAAAVAVAAASAIASDEGRPPWQEDATAQQLPPPESSMSEALSAEPSAPEQPAALVQPSPEQAQEDPAAAASVILSEAPPPQVAAEQPPSPPAAAAAAASDDGGAGGAFSMSDFAAGLASMGEIPMEDESAVPKAAQPGDEDYVPAPPPPPSAAATEKGDIAVDTSNPDSVLTKLLGNFKDNWDPYDRSDVPVFLHIPKAGGSTLKDVVGTCHRLVMATDMGIFDGHDDDPEVAVVYPGGGPPGQDRTPFVNVDTTTTEGIERARDMGFAESGLADAVVTPFMYEANDLFVPTAKGRIFTVFRHPVDRAISMFYYVQVADWEPTYAPELKDWTLRQYAESEKVENNWLTRILTNKNGSRGEDLTDADLKLAMEIIRRKFLVGLMAEMTTTMERFEKFFHWTYHVNPPNQEKCRESLMAKGSNQNAGAGGRDREKVEEGSEIWNLLATQNRFDLQLYGYIESLFKEQAAFVEGIPDGFRNLDATCCKCGPPTFPPEGFTCPQSIMN